MSDLLEKEKRAIKLLRTVVEFDNGVKNATILCDRNTAMLIKQHLVPTNFKLKYRIRKTALNYDKARNATANKTHTELL